MIDFFEEYSWSLISVLGGAQGIQILFYYLFDNNLFSGIIEMILEGMM